MTLMLGLHHFFLEMSKKYWPRFCVRNSTLCCDLTDLSAELQEQLYICIYTVKASMSGHRRSPIFCPFNRDVRSKEIYLVQRKKYM
jgi:hypothetical protein